MCVYVNVCVCVPIGHNEINAWLLNKIIHDVCGCIYLEKKRMVFTFIPPERIHKVLAVLSKSPPKDPNYKQEAVRENEIQSASRNFIGKPVFIEHHRGTYGYPTTQVGLVAGFSRGANGEWICELHIDMGSEHGFLAINELFAKILNDVSISLYFSKPTIKGEIHHLATAEISLVRKGGNEKTHVIAHGNHRVFYANLNVIRDIKNMPIHNHKSVHPIQAIYKMNASDAASDAVAMAAKLAAAELALKAERELHAMTKQKYEASSFMNDSRAQKAITSAIDNTKLFISEANMDGDCAEIVDSMKGVFNASLGTPHCETFAVYCASVAKIATDNKRLEAENKKLKDAEAVDVGSLKRLIANLGGEYKKSREDGGDLPDAPDRFGLETAASRTLKMNASDAPSKFPASIAGWLASIPNTPLPRQTMAKMNASAASDAGGEEHTAAVPKPNQRRPLDMASCVEKANTMAKSAPTTTSASVM